MNNRENMKTVSAADFVKIIKDKAKPLSKEEIDGNVYQRGLNGLIISEPVIISLENLHNGIEFMDCIFEGKVTIRVRCEKSFNLHFTCVDFIEDIEIRDSSFKLLSIDAGQEMKKVTISNCTIEKISFTGQEISESKIIINRGVFGIVCIEKYINSFTTSEQVIISEFFCNSKNPRTKIDLIDGSDINTIKFSGNYYDGAGIKLRRITFSNIVMEKFNFDGVIEIESSKIKEHQTEINQLPTNTSKIQITDSKIQLLIFNDLKTDLLSSIKITNSNIETIKSFATKVPIEKLSSPDKSGYYFINQLYLDSKSKNDKELEYKYLRSSKKLLLKSLRKSPWQNINAIGSMIPSAIYSNHGRRWILAAFLTVIFAAILFTIMMLTTKYRLSLRNGVGDFPKLLSYFCQFINPTHKISFMDYAAKGYAFSIKPQFAILDLLSRIIIGIGIYETIKSFRRL